MVFIISQAQKKYLGMFYSAKFYKQSIKHHKTTTYTLNIISNL